LGHVGLGEPGTDGCQANIGSVQAVAIDLATGMRYGAADPRRDGTVIRVKSVAKVPDDGP
jgi:gamma-glutamyltranspeptidase/glutathione hydrolase